MNKKNMLQVTFGNIYSKSDGYKKRGELIHRLFSEHFIVSTFQVLNKNENPIEDSIKVGTFFSKAIILLFLPFLIFRKIKNNEIILIEGSMFISNALFAKLLGKTVVFDPQGSIAIVGKRTKRSLYNTIFRLMIGNVLDYICSHIADKCIFVSEEDMEYFLMSYNISKEKAMLVRLAIDTDELVMCPDEIKDEKKIVFMGDLTSIQNKTAVEYIINYIAPKLSDHKFIIVGKGFEKFDQIENVIFEGFVKEPSRIICSCQLAIVPLISGTGVKTKILEFLYMGIPVITTTVGVEGLIKSLDIIEKGLFLSDLSDFPSKIKNTMDYIKNIDTKFLRKYILNNHSLNAMREDINVFVYNFK